MYTATWLSKWSVCIFIPLAISKLPYTKTITLKFFYTVTKKNQLSSTKLFRPEKRNISKVMTIFTLQFS